MLGETVYSPAAQKRMRKNHLDWVNHYKAKGCNDRKADECARRKNCKPFNL